MECPKCNSEFTTIEYEGIEVDRCTRCKGIWFDLLEHEALKKIKGSEAIDAGDPALGQEYNKIDRIDCPKCKTRMVRMVDNDQPHIWYEACEEHGMYFDAGEFTDYKYETILDKFRDLVTGKRKH